MHLFSGLARLVPAGSEDLQVSTVFLAAHGPDGGRVERGGRTGYRRLMVAEERRTSANLVLRSRLSR
jgi:hypothetical protein